MIENSRADIMTIRVNESIEDIGDLIETTLTELGISNKEDISINKEPVAVRVKGACEDECDKAFAIEIIVREERNFRNIDFIALGGKDTSAPTVIDFDESEKMRRKILRYITKAEYEEIKKRLNYLKVNKLREIRAKVKTAAESDSDLKNNTAYIAAREDEEKLNNEIERLEKDLENAREIFCDDYRRSAASFFSYNTRYFDMTDQDIADRSGIDVKRVQEISEGAQPLLTEMLRIADTFDVPFKVIEKEWFVYTFGKYTTLEATFAELVKEENAEAAAALISLGMFVKVDDKLRLCEGNSVVSGVLPDDEVLKSARELLLKKGLASAASDISVPGGFYGVGALSEAVCDEEVIKRYLFDAAGVNVKEYFTDFVNALSNDADREKILGFALEAMERFRGRECIGQGENVREYIISEEPSDEDNPALFVLRHYDYSGTKKGGEILEKIMRLQEELFEGER